MDVRNIGRLCNRFTSTLAVIGLFTGSPSSVSAMENPSAGVPRPLPFKQAAAIDLPEVPSEAGDFTDEMQTDEIWPDANQYLEQAIRLALERNPQLRGLSEQSLAAFARVKTVGVPPDPMVGFNVFGNPQLMADGPMRADFMVSQTIPWLKRLKAEQQQAVFEAMAADQMLRDRQLAIIAELKASYYLLYQLDQQVRLNLANQQILERLIQVASQRVATGSAAQGDVLLGTLELSRLAEDLLSLEQRRRTSQARVNRLIDQPAETEIASAPKLQVPGEEPQLSAMLDLASETQPALVAARLRTQAADWGIQVARLQGLPDVTVTYQRMFMEESDNPMFVEHGAGNPWTMGLSMNVPIWRGKYRAITQRARHERQAQAANVDDLLRETESMLLELIEQSKAARRTAELYDRTILPQARQTLQADQQSYGQGKVEFDRVVSDFRNLLTLEANYHRAIAEQATAQARMEQTVGATLTAVPPLSRTDSSSPTKQTP